LHQLRVGLRRLRAALRAFRKIVPRDCAAPVVEPLRALGPALGEARDLDVFCARLDRLLPTGGVSSNAGATLLRYAAERRRAVQLCLRQDLRARRFAHWVSATQGWLERAPWRESSAVPGSALRRPLAEHARRSLKRMGRKLRRSGDSLDWSDVPARHEFRIRLKRFRYACEFFRDALAELRTAKLIGRLKRLQDLLGELNDLRVAEQLLAELASIPDLQDAAGRRAFARLRQRLAHEAKALQRQLAPAWKEISRARQLS
jgi:CHAD domain-containing protein